MPSQPSPPLDLLLAHMGGLRALSRALLVDEHTAEDVLQETWLVALERPPGSPVGLGGWLHGVARRVALKQRRGAARRTRREAQAARAEPIASVDEELARREVLRDVVDAVLGLAEPYQSVVLMRYYEDLPPRAIAERLDLPVATVKSQLHRAREQLRRRLDGPDGERGPWALALAGVLGWKRVMPAAAKAGGLGTWLGGIAMEWKLSAAAAALAALYFGTTNHLDTSASGASSPAVATQDQALASAPGGRAAALQENATPETDGPDARVPATVPAEPGRLLEGPPALPHAFAVVGTVVDERDLPVAGASIEVAPLGHPWSPWGETDENGGFRVEWRGRAPAQELAVRIHGDRGPALTSLLACRAGGEQQRRFALLPALPLPPLVEEIGEESGPADPVSAGTLSFVSTSISMMEHNEFFTAGTSVERGSTRFQWPVIVPEEQIEEVFLIGTGGGRGNLQLALEFSGGASGAFVSDENAEGSARVRITVRDGDGEVLPDADVSVLGRRSEFLVHPGRAGTFELSLPVGRTYSLRAGGGDHGLAFTELDLGELEEGAEVSWDPQLDRALEVRGRLLDSTGAPLERWTVEFVSADGRRPWHDATATRGGGHFAIPNVPDVPGVVYVTAPGAVYLPRLAVANVRPGPGELAIEPTAEQLATGALSAVVVDARGEPAGDADVMLWQLETGRGLALPFDAERGVFALDGIPVGRYRLTAGRVESGYRQPVELEITADEPTELVGLALPRGGTLAWDVTLPEGIDPNALSWTLVRTTAVDSMAGRGSLAGIHAEEIASVELPAGDYAVFAAAEGFASPGLEARVHPGAQSSIQVDLAALRPVDLRLADASSEGGMAVKPQAARLEIAGPDGRVLVAAELDQLGDLRTFLPEGEFVVSLAAGDGRRARTDIHVAADGASAALSLP